MMIIPKKEKELVQEHYPRHRGAMCGNADPVDYDDLGRALRRDDDYYSEPLDAEVIERQKKQAFEEAARALQESRSKRKDNKVS